MFHLQKLTILASSTIIIMKTTDNMVKIWTVPQEAFGYFEMADSCCTYPTIDVDLNSRKQEGME